MEDFQRLDLPEKGAGAGRTTDLVKSGNYICSIGNGAFTVTDVSDPAAPKVCGSVSGLGNTRQTAYHTHHCSDEPGTHSFIKTFKAILSHLLQDWRAKSDTSTATAR